MKEHLVIHSLYDQLPLDVIIMSPSHPKGVVQFSHGMCEHKERYLDFMSFLNKQGYVCCIHDHRGHGKSVYCEDDLGYFYKDGHIGIVEDLHQLTMMMKKRYPNLPIYLFGHSMGSLVVRCYTKKYDDDIDGLIVCGSPSLNKASGIGLRFSSLISRIKNDHYRPQSIQKLGFDVFNKKYDRHVQNSWICSDKNIVEAYNQDPLCTFTFTANGFHALFTLMQETYSKDHWGMKNPSLPIYFIAGYQDPCIINPQAFKQAVSLMKEVGYQDVSSHLFKHMQHEILNEKDKHIVYQDILKKLELWNH